MTFNVIVYIKIHNKRKSFKHPRINKKNNEHNSPSFKHFFYNIRSLYLHEKRL